MNLIFTWLIVDYFNEYVVIQISTLGMEKDKDLIIQALINNIPNLKGIYEKSEVMVEN